MPQISTALQAVPALLALLLGACASTPGARSPESAAPVAAKSASAPAAAAAPALAMTADDAAAQVAMNASSPLVQEGQDPVLAGPGIDIRKSPEGFTPLPVALKTRADQRWKLLIEGKGEQAYDYLTAGVRSSIDREVYASDMRSRPIKWLRAEALDGQCEGDSCSVRVLIDVKFSIQSSGGKEMETETAITERWIRVGDNWSHIPDEYLEGFAK